MTRKPVPLVLLSVALGAVSALAQTTVTTSGGTTSTVPLFTGSATIGNSNVTQSGGNVGIGTASPGQLLQVGATYSQNPAIMIGGRDNNNSSTGNYSLLFGAFRDIETVASGIVATPVWTCCGGYPASGYAGIRSNTLGFYTMYDPTSPTSYSPNMLINQNGNVGIGTANPGASLEVNGSVKLTGGSGASMTFQDGSVQTVAWNGVLSGGDYAESVDVIGDRKSYEPGDVLVVDPAAEGRFVKSSQPYSTNVMGVYSTRPGVVGRRQTSERSHMAEEVPMAMVGVIPTKVCAEGGPIKPGDLLVTSSTPGYAMKGTDRTQMLGAIIGKALGHLDAGVGVMDVGVSIQ